MADDKKKILLIEDDPSIGQLIFDMLENDGFQVIWERGAVAGLKQYSQQALELLITDIDLPDMKGFDVCRVIREKPFGFITPIIFMSALDTMQGRVEGFSMGGDDYLSKPFSYDGLIQKVAAVIEVKKKRLMTDDQETHFPGFNLLVKRFDELKGTGKHMIYHTVAHYYRILRKLKSYDVVEEVKNWTGKLQKTAGIGEIYHLDGPHFVFLGSESKPEELFFRIIKDSLSHFVPVEGREKVALHFCGLDLKKAAGRNILDLVPQLTALMSRLDPEKSGLVLENGKIVTASDMPF
ncbi:MAG TPA: response regulator [bacterium]|nr:response regulator [bacterium]